MAMDSIGDLGAGKTLQAQLRNASDSTVIERSVKGAIMYPIVLTVLVFATEWRTEHQALGILLLALTGVVSAIRLFYLRHLLANVEYVAKQTPRLLAPLVLAPALLCGIFVATTYTIFSIHSTASILAILIALAFAPGGTSSLAVNRKLHFLFLVVLLLPLSVVALASGTSAGITIGAMSLLNMLFLLREGTAANASFVEIIEKSFALQEAVSSLEKNQVELLHANESMQLVLDNIEQGLCVIDTAGVMGAQSSKAFEAWFGSTTPGKKLVDHLGDEAFADWFNLSIDMLTEDVMPAEVVIDQLPKTLHHKERHMSFTYRPIEHDGVLSGLLVVVSDNTEIVAAELAEFEQRELVHLLQLLARDPDGFREFRTSGAALVANITDEAQARVEQIRHLHTLKGNAGLLGVTSIATLCHTIEDELADAEHTLNSEQSQRLGAAWGETDARMATILGERDDVLEVSEAEHSQLLARLHERAPYAELAHLVQDWRLESVPRRFERMAMQTRLAAKKLGKDVCVSVDAPPLRLDANEWRNFWMACIHLLRNSVDHGIEDSKTRIANRKSASGSVCISARQDGDDLVIAIRDDGKGIDWSKVAERAQKLGVPCETEDELRDALFHDGLSTTDQVSTLSGRGVGLSALAHEAALLGGTIQIESTPGEGTEFAIRVPSSSDIGSVEKPAAAAV